MNTIKKCCNAAQLQRRCGKVKDLHSTILERPQGRRFDTISDILAINLKKKPNLTLCFLMRVLRYEV